MSDYSRKWWILAAMTSSISMIFIDITVLPVALPTIERMLGISELGLQWIVNAYTLVLAVLVLAGGRLGDRVGHRPVFCWGLILFALGSALCGVSYGELTFIASRALQGVGGALLIPTGSAIIIESFPPQQRGRAMGIYVSVGSLFLAIGPFIGGIFTQYFSWRLIFWINLPIAAVGYFLTLKVVPNRPGKKEHFDWVGFSTSLVGITCLVVAIMQSKEWGLASPLTLGLLGFGVLLLVLLGIVDRKATDPYIDFSLFKQRLFVGGILAIFCMQFLVMVTVFWAIFFQNGLGFTPSQAGVISLLANAPIIIAAPLAGYLMDKRGPKLPMTLGFCLITLSIIWFLQVLDTKNIPLLLSAVIPFGMGVPLVLTPSFTTALNHVASTKRGLASGTITMLRQVGASLGLAIFTSLYLFLTENRFAEALLHNPETENLSAHAFSGLLAKAPKALNALQALSPSAREYVEKNYAVADATAFSQINFLAIFVAIVGLMITLVLIKKRRDT